jgi:hypothetical protein
MLTFTRVILYKHGVGYFERQGQVQGDATLTLTFKQAEVSDVLKSLTVLDLQGGHIASVSYDSTKPLEQLLSEVALSIPDQGSLVGLLPQIKGARLAVAGPDNTPVEGLLLGVDTSDKQTPSGIVHDVLLSLLTDGGEVRSFELQALRRLEILDATLRRDLEHYLRTLLSAKKKDARTFTFFAQGQGERTIRMSYTLEAPVWKATYRIILGEKDRPALIQGWAVVDNTQDEDWENVELSLVAGLPVSFQHDLYTPRYIRRPTVAVKETTGVLPPQVEEGMNVMHAVPPPGRLPARMAAPAIAEMRAPLDFDRDLELALDEDCDGAEEEGTALEASRSAVSSTRTQVRERKLGDLFAYDIEHPVTIRRNQSALVPIVLRPFEGRPVLLYNQKTRKDNPLRCVEFKNTTGLTLEGGPLTVLEEGSYVGEAMLDTLKPDTECLVPYAVELGVTVLDNIDTHKEEVHRVVLRGGHLTLYRIEARLTTYFLNNKSDREQTLYLDHPRGHSEWTLHDTPAPREITESYWRFQFTLPARQVTSFPVQQRMTVQQVRSVGDLDPARLSVWVEQRYVDARTEAALRRVIEEQQRLAEARERVADLEGERDAIHAEQKRIRENLLALGDRSSEKELRERFIRTLNSQEDRLEQITQEVKSRMTEIAGRGEQLKVLLADLEYEASVPQPK